MEQCTHQRQRITESIHNQNFEVHHVRDKECETDDEESRKNPSF
jgi:hypothetical protein